MGSKESCGSSTHFAPLATGKAEPKLRFSGFSFPSTPRVMWRLARVVSPGPVLDEGEERGRLACSSALGKFAVTSVLAVDFGSKRIKQVSSWR